MGGACSTEGLTLQFDQVPCGGDPKSREGHVLAECSGGKLVVFGGTDEDRAVHVLGPDGAWSVAGEAPARVGAACASSGETVFVFGGVDPEQGCWLNELLMLDTAARTVARVAAGADGPSPRDKAALVAAGGFLVLFGGFGPLADDPMRLGEDEGVEEEEEDNEEDEGMDPAKFGWCNDLFVFGAQQQSWRAVAASNPPPARAAHAMTLSGGRLWVFGGKTAAARVADLWSIGLAEVLQGAPGLAWTLHEAPQGVAPSGRSFHALVAVPESPRLLLFGGRDNEDARLADVHVYDPQLHSWAQPSFCANVPADFAGAGALRGGDLVLHGVEGAFVAASLAPVRTAKIALPEKHE